MSEKRYYLKSVCGDEGLYDKENGCIIINKNSLLDLDENWNTIVDLLNELHEENKELKTYNLQHFLEWLVIKGYVTDELMKDINNVIDCVDKFKEYLTDEQFEKELLDNGK